MNLPVLCSQVFLKLKMHILKLKNAYLGMHILKYVFVL